MTFIFVGQKNKSRMVKFKLHPGDKQPHHTANRNPFFATICTDSMLIQNMLSVQIAC